MNKLISNSWTGALILHGTSNFLPVLLNICGSSKHVVYGNVSPIYTASNINTSLRLFNESAVPEDVVPFIDTVNSQWEAKPHSFIIGSSEIPSHVNITTRSADILSWGQGIMNMEKGQKSPIDLLLDLNRNSKPNDDKNYTTLFAERVASQIPGKWLSCIAYLGIKSVFILSTRGVSLNLWLVFFDGAFFLLWSTDPNAVDYLEYDLGKHAIGNRERFFTLGIKTEANEVLAMHPLFLVSKFAKKYSSYLNKNKANLLVCHFIARYLSRQIQTFTL